MDSLDPAAARQALTAAEEQQRKVVSAAPVSRWAWPAGLVAFVGIVAAQDFISGPLYLALDTSLILLVLAAVLVPRFWPRAAGADALVVNPRPVREPTRGYVASFIFGEVVFVLVAFAVLAVGDIKAPEALAQVGAQRWIAEHPHVVAAAIIGLPVMVAAWALDRAFRIRHSL